ncbi:anti-sigma factor [Winogradskyella sp. 3972H.M.0a.05]|uniref:anti-sigma factor n=1 Tax=Winogradskyella sp. 3972H.M.0a.05 TaxID=2950277 RepID=UPI00339962D3
MDKKNIRETGILEQYILGELDATQQREVEHLLENDADLAKYVSELEKSFESLAFENAIDPPNHIKDSLLTQITAKEDNVVPITKRRINKWYVGIAASFAAFLLVSTYLLYSELQEVKSELEVVNTEKESIKEDLNGLTQNYNTITKWYAAITDPEAEQFVLKGNQLAPEAKIVSYVNHNNKTVVINAQNLPELDALHDYQMWADVEGEMINMGVIAKGEQMLAMTYIDNAESLNITIEPAGGNDHPTVERLISNVYL